MASRYITKTYGGKYDQRSRSRSNFSCLRDLPSNNPQVVTIIIVLPLINIYSGSWCGWKVCRVYFQKIWQQQWSTRKIYSKLQIKIQELLSEQRNLCKCCYQGKSMCHFIWMYLFPIHDMLYSQWVTFLTSGLCQPPRHPYPLPLPALLPASTIQLCKGLLPRQGWVQRRVPIWSSIHPLGLLSSKWSCNRACLAQHWESEKDEEAVPGHFQKQVGGETRFRDHWPWYSYQGNSCKL